ncbi:gamma carbonic anhydrase family protein [Vibrio algarum]|uniref:Gamma carbonic anhydrase family protein n=1 Tax=Vibrio algarum TaxID=3020714 RepID=A0ABT4YM09_9VIBR|nr:gamma carbonic anhydrase family protein [Vibrio sp. KJ40-1]MDB1122555.1 gamma carbonic anhydrase family protein [Vibrio sp. KJ40-1]
MSKLRSYKGICPQINKSAYIDESSVLVGDIKIGEDSSVWPFVSARADVNHIYIGNRTNVQDGTVLHVTHKSDSNPNGYPLIIGNDVTVGHKVMLHGCTIKDRVLVGMAAIVLDGATIEEDVMIGAGSLVPPNKVLESGYLYVGSPVKQIRPLKEQELLFLKKSAQNYVENKNDYLEHVSSIS